MRVITVKVAEWFGKFRALGIGMTTARWQLSERISMGCGAVL